MATYSALGQSLPDDTGARLASFTELVATAIANTQARTEVGRLAEEQAALRRVATLVAREASPAEVFSVVTEELGRLIGADIAALARLEPGNTATVVAAWSEGGGDHVPVGTRISLEDESVARTVMETGRPARRDNLQQASDSISAMARQLGVISTVGTPIVVEGRLWGGMSVSHASPTSQSSSPPPSRTPRLGPSSALLAHASSRPRMRRGGGSSATSTTASSSGSFRSGSSWARRRRRCPRSQPSSRACCRALARGWRGVIDELREISRGIHPAILSERGLEPALRALCRRSAVPVELDLDAERRLPEPVEAAAYYVVSEALTNAAKHAHASVVNVELDTHDANLQLAIRDDGSGEPTSVGGPDWSGSAIESKRSAARSRSPAPPARAPRS